MNPKKLPQTLIHAGDILTRLGMRQLIALNTINLALEINSD
ncbi:hypothetical protein MCEGE10_00452 [Flavobacteriaceae bacterium]